MKRNLSGGEGREQSHSCRIMLVPGTSAMVTVRSDMEEKELRNCSGHFRRIPFLEPCCKNPHKDRQYRIDKPDKAADRGLHQEPGKTEVNR